MGKSRRETGAFQPRFPDILFDENPGNPDLSRLDPFAVNTDLDLITLSKLMAGRIGSILVSTGLAFSSSTKFWHFSLLAKDDKISKLRTDSNHYWVYVLLPRRRCDVKEGSIQY